MCAVLLATLFPYFEKIHSANELARLYIADAIVLDHTVSIDGPIRRHTHVPDKARRKGRTYSDKAPGITAAIIAPLWVLSLWEGDATLATKMRIGRLFGATLPLFFLLWALAVFLARKRVRWRVRLAVVAALALASPLTVYGVLLFGHGLAATLIFCAFVHVDAIVADGSRRDLWRCFVVGACVGWAVATEYPSAVFLLPAAALYAVRVTSRDDDDRWKRALWCVAASVAGAAPFVGGVLVYHQLAFGSPFATGYAFLVNKTFANVHAQGFMGIVWPDPKNFAQAFFAPNKGIFVFAPWFLLVIAPSLVRMRRLPPATRRALWATLLLMVLFVSAMVFPGGGWTVSQRHLVPWLPFAAAAIAIGLSTHARPIDVVIRALFVAGALGGFAMCFASLLVWPYLFDDLQSPVAQLIWPALLDGWRVPSTLSVVGLPSSLIAVVALGVVVVAGGALIALPTRSLGAARSNASARGRLLAAAVALAGLYVGVFVVTAPSQEKVVRKRRVRLERAYLLDPDAQPRRLAERIEEEDRQAKELGRKKARANPSQQRAAKNKRRRAERRAATSLEGQRVQALLDGLQLSVDTGSAVVRCKAKDKRGKISCPTFGAGVFVRRAFLHDDTMRLVGRDASAKEASASRPRVALRAYLPREGGALVFDFDGAAAKAVSGFWIVSASSGADVVVESLPDDRVVVGAAKDGVAKAKWTRGAASKDGSLRLRLQAPRGDRELFLLPLSTDKSVAKVPATPE